MKGASCLLAFIGGAIAGAAVALLTAPKSGAETREMIREYVDDLKDEIKPCHCSDLTDDVKE